MNFLYSDRSSSSHNYNSMSSLENWHWYYIVVTIDYLKGKYSSYIYESDQSLLWSYTRSVTAK